MKENFNTYIDHIEPDFWRELCVSKGRLQHFAKGEEFVSIDKVGNCFGFIQSGVLKYVARSTDGTEHVVAMVFDDGFVADWRSILSNQKAKVAIVAVSDCEIYCLSTKIIDKMMDSDSYFRDIVMRTTNAIYGTLYDRHIDMYCKSPKQRYYELVSRHADLFDLFSLKDIASFLNITPTHLSRLRKDEKRHKLNRISPL